MEDEFPDAEQHEEQAFLPEPTDDDHGFPSHFHDPSDNVVSSDEDADTDPVQNHHEPPSSDEGAVLQAEPGFEDDAEPIRNYNVPSSSRELRLTYPLTNFNRDEIIAAFSSLKIRYSVSDKILLEIFQILNCMRDPFSSQRPLPETRYAVTRCVHKNYIECSFTNTLYAFVPFKILFHTPSFSKHFLTCIH
jgi:hypothetical protein